jgi:hypothetical protein
MIAITLVLALSRSPSAQTCELTNAQPWMQRWLEAWDFTSRELLRLPPAPLPNIVFYDDACVYTTSPVTAGAAAKSRAVAIPSVGGKWWATAHGGTITLPNGKSVPVRLMSFTDSDKKTGPFFVMAAPDYWKQSGHGQEPGLTGVFLHEITHTRQFAGVKGILGPIDASWKGPEELDDDIVQTRFGSNAEYVAEYNAERDLLYRAAEAESIADTRAFAAQALDAMKKRRARWFTGENAVFATLDGLWLSMEGAGQWAAYAWLSNPRGGGMTRDEAMKKMTGSRKHWTQDEGLALFLVVDRLLPEWPSLVFRTPSMGALELLEHAVKSEHTQRS